MFFLPVFSAHLLRLLASAGILAVGYAIVAGMTFLVFNRAFPAWFSLSFSFVAGGLIAHSQLGSSLATDLYAAACLVPALLLGYSPFSDWNLSRFVRWLFFQRADRLAAYRELAVDASPVELEILQDTLLTRELDYRQSWLALRLFFINSLAILLTMSFDVAAVSRFGVHDGVLLICLLFLPLIVIILGDPTARLTTLASEEGSGSAMIRLIGWMLLIGLMNAGPYLVHTVFPGIKGLLSL